MAALSHNNNVGRKPAMVKKIDDSGEEFKVEFEIWKEDGKNGLSVMFMKKCQMTKTLSNMIEILEGSLWSTWESKNIQFPKNIATEERPETSAAILKHRTRLPVV